MKGRVLPSVEEITQN